MKTFTDNAGRPWTLVMNVAVLKRVKSLAGLDLNTLLDGGETLQRLTTDACLLGDVLFAACHHEAEVKNVNEESFLSALAGDALDKGLEALLAELVDFTRNPRDRARLSRVLGKMDRYNETARDLMDSRLDQADAVFAAAFSQAVAKADEEMGRLLGSPGSSSTKPPESAESTPVPSPLPS